MLYRNHRAAHIGILVIALAGAALAFPIFAALVVITLASLKPWRCKACAMDFGNHVVMRI